MNWRLLTANIVVSVGIARAEAQPISAQILPNGHVQFVTGGPEFDGRQFMQQLFRMKRQTPIRELHLYVRSQAALDHVGDVTSRAASAGFKVRAID